MSKLSFSAWRLPFMSTPANPPAGEGLLYFKSDGSVYKKVGSVESRVDGGGPPLRWGQINAWAFIDSTDVGPPTFADGQMARVGDMVTSYNGYALGEVYEVTNVYPATGNVDIRYTGNKIYTSTDSGWIEPTLTSPWAHFPNEEKFGYRKKDGIVYFKGILQWQSAGSPVGTAWIFLPPSFRPKNTSVNGFHQQVVYMFNTMVTMYIRDSDGAMYLQTGVSVNGAHVLMSGITPYPADE